MFETRLNAFARRAWHSLSGQLLSARERLRGGGVFALQLVFNGVSAYAFQKAFAYYYGASVEKTIFDIAFAVPFMLVYVSGFGMTHSIVVVLFSQRERQLDAERASRDFSSLLNLSLIGLCASALAVVVLAKPLAVWLAPGLTTSQREAVEQLVIAFVPLAATSGISSHLSAVAVAYRIPIAQELLLLVTRCVVVVWILVAGEAVPLTRVAAIFAAASAMTVVAQWFLLRRKTPIRYLFTMDLGSPGVRAALHQFIGFVVIALVGQFATAYMKRVGTLIGPNVVATIGFAASLLEPIGTILGKLITFVEGPRMASSVADNAADAARVLGKTAGIAVAGSVPIAALLYWAMPTVISILFEGGAFKAGDAAATTELARIMVLQVPFHLLTWVTLYPLLAASRQAAAVTYLAGYLAQIWFLQAFGSTMGARGLAWSFPFFTATQATVGILVLVVVVRLGRGRGEAKSGETG